MVYAYTAFDSTTQTNGSITIDVNHAPRAAPAVSFSYRENFSP